VEIWVNPACSTLDEAAAHDADLLVGRDPESLAKVLSESMP
jgi:hypothetical protein